MPYGYCGFSIPGSRAAIVNLGVAKIALIIYTNNSCVTFLLFSIIFMIKKSLNPNGFFFIQKTRQDY